MIDGEVIPIKIPPYTNLGVSSHGHLIMGSLKNMVPYEFHQQASHTQYPMKFTGRSLLILFQWTIYGTKYCSVKKVERPRYRDKGKTFWKHICRFCVGQGESIYPCSLQVYGQESFFNLGFRKNIQSSRMTRDFGNKGKRFYLKN